MGSAESHLVAGVFPGDSQRDEDLPQILTPDLLERTWLDLEPSPDLDMPGRKAFGEAFFATSRFGPTRNRSGSVWHVRQTRNGNNWESLQRWPGDFWWPTIGGKSSPIQMQSLGKKTKKLKWMLL